MVEGIITEVCQRDIRKHIIPGGNLPAERHILHPHGMCKIKKSVGLEHILYTIRMKQQHVLVGMITHHAPPVGSIPVGLHLAKVFQREIAVLVLSLTPVAMIQTILVHAVNIEGMSAKRVVVTNIGNRATCHQFILKNPVPCIKTIKTSVQNLYGLVPKHLL